MQINGFLGDNSTLQGSSGLRTNEMNFVINHAPCAGSIDRLVDQNFSMLPLYHGCSRYQLYLKCLISRNSFLLPQQRLFRTSWLCAELWLVLWLPPTWIGAAPLGSVCNNNGNDVMEIGNVF